MAEKHKRYVTMSGFAVLCDCGLPNISNRIKDSFNGKFKKGDKRYIELTEHPECEGHFIDTDLYKPVRFKRRLN
jgi:hypothetical protein